MKTNSIAGTNEAVNGRQERPLQKFGRFYTLAIEMAVAVIAPVLAGQWLDSRTGKEPWFMVAGMVLGGAAAIRSAHRALTEALGDLKRDEGASGDGAENRGSAT
jgi:F0F1-type ATP synthase assembly protein I